MNYQESINLLHSEKKFQINLGLERMQKLASLFDNPQENLNIIHIAGTNGKGSTCAMLAKICETNNLKTGLFTSPHIKNYTERIKINFQDISEKDFSKYLEIVENKANQNNISLTEFEILTMMSFLYFNDNNVQIAIMETGMGGRLDATNIAKSPILTIITSISKDHADRLGNTIDEIAFEKAGILKKDTPVIISKNNAGLNVVKQQASKVGAGVFEIEKDFSLINPKDNIFSNGNKEYKLALRGLNQGQNLALVDAACEYLTLNPQNALSEVIWNSRLEYLPDKNILVDAAHNPDAVLLLRKNLDIYYKNKKRAFLFGVLNTKDYKTIIKNLFTPEDEIFVTDNFSYNAVDKNILADEILKNYSNIKLKIINIEEINDCFVNYNFDGIKICCGSFYICSKIFE